MSKPWYKQKTTWTCLVAVATGVGGLVTQSMDTTTAIQTILAGFGGLFMRQAVNEGKNGQ